MVTSSRHPSELLVCFWKKERKKSWSLSSSWSDPLSAVGNVGKPSYDNNDLWIYKDRLFLQSSSEHFLSHRFERFEIRLEICSPCRRNGLPLIWGDVTGFWLKDQAVEGKLIHLFLAPVTHIRIDARCCLFCKQVYCLEMSPLFLKKNLLL